MSGKDIFIEHLLQEGTSQGDIKETEEGVLLFPIDFNVTGVDIAELELFPQEPPHWCHIPEDIHVADCFEPRNDPPVFPGHKKYSVSLSGWGQPQSGEKNFSPIRAWKQAVRARLYSAGE